MRQLADSPLRDRKIQPGSLAVVIPLKAEVTDSDQMEIFWSAQEMGVNAMMLCSTVISGYLLVAYLFGRDLTRSESQFISGIFVVSRSARSGASPSTGGRATWLRSCRSLANREMRSSCTHWA